MNTPNGYHRTHYITVIEVMPEDEHFTREQMWAEHAAIHAAHNGDTLADRADRDAKLWELHHRAYAQFVTEQTKANVWFAFGPELLKSTDRAFNDIGLQRWDFMNCPVRAPKSRRSWSPSDQVCILKAAARIALAEHANGTRPTPTERTRRGDDEAAHYRSIA